MADRVGRACEGHERGAARGGGAEPRADQADRTDPQEEGASLFMY